MMKTGRSNGRSIDGIVICHPNSPTGQACSADDVARLAIIARRQGLWLVIDEAFADYCPERSVLPHAASWPHVVVLRSMTKFYALPGLRVGYALGDPYLLDAARAAAIPLSVTEPAQRAAIAALDHEPELLERVASICAQRDAVWQALTDQGWRIPKPQGNFVWLATGESTGEAAETLLRHGIVGRALGTDGIRVSIGEPESVEKLLSGAAEVVKNLTRMPAVTAID